MIKLATLILLTLLIGVGPAHLYSQTACDNGTLQPVCNPSIPSNAIVVSTNMTISGAGGFACYWVCPGATLTLSGAANSQIYLEENAGLNLLGGENYVWMKDNSTCLVQAGSNTNWVNKKASASLTDNGTNTSVNTCTTLTYQDSNAPVEGCGIVNSILDAAQYNSINIFPNPSTGRIQIDLAGSDLAVNQIQMYAVNGKLISEIGREGLQDVLILDVSHYDRGFYILRMITNQGELTKKLLLTY